MSMGSMLVLIPTPEVPLQTRIDVVTADLPMPVGLDVLTRHGLNIMVAGELKSAEADGSCHCCDKVAISI
jgi:hypothetical protein